MEYVSHAFPDTVELVPGLELLSDRFRCPALPLLASLGQVAGELVQRKHAVRVSASVHSTRSLLPCTVPSNALALPALCSDCSQEHQTHCPGQTAQGRRHAVANN